jgi:hypothetical protein
MASAMAGLIAQPSLQGIAQASLPSLNSSSICRQRVSCSLRLTSSGFGKDPTISGTSTFLWFGERRPLSQLKEIVTTPVKRMYFILELINDANLWSCEFQLDITCAHVPVVVSHLFLELLRFT